MATSIQQVGFSPTGGLRPAFFLPGSCAWQHECASRSDAHPTKRKPPGSSWSWLRVAEQRALSEPQGCTLVVYYV